MIFLTFSVIQILNYPPNFEKIVSERYECYGLSNDLIISVIMVLGIDTVSSMYLYNP